MLFIDFAFHKLVDFWNPVPKTDNWFLVMANAVPFGGAALFTLIGLLLLLAWPEMRKPFVFLFYSLIGFYMLQSMIFTGGIKARLPVEPLMVLLAVFSAGSLLKCALHHGESWSVGARAGKEDSGDDCVKG